MINIQLIDRSVPAHRRWAPIGSRATECYANLRSPVLNREAISNRYTKLLETPATLTKQSSPPSSNRYKLRGAPEALSACANIGAPVLLVALIAINANGKKGALPSGASGRGAFAAGWIWFAARSAVADGDVGAIHLDDCADCDAGGHDSAGLRARGKRHMARVRAGDG